MVSRFSGALSTKMWSILRRSFRNCCGEECNHGIECGRTGGRPGSGRRFSSARRQNLSHHRAIQSGTAGAGYGGTRRAATAAADARPRRRTDDTAARNRAAEERAGRDSRACREDVGADRVDCRGQLSKAIGAGKRRSQPRLCEKRRKRRPHGEKRLMATATKDQVVKDPQNASVRVEIFDQAYNLRGSDPEYILKLAEYVDAKMRAVAEATNTIDTVRLAVLAALNIADEYHLLKKRQDVGPTDYLKRAHILSNALDEVLAEKRKAG